MEAATPVAPIERSTGSETIADLMLLAVDRYADKAAMRFKRDGQWQDVTFAEQSRHLTGMAQKLTADAVEPLQLGMKSALSKTV